MGPSLFAVAVTYGPACRAIELMQSYGPEHDLARLGRGTTGRVREYGRGS